MDEGPTDEKRSNLIQLPSGRTIDPKEVGVDDYVSASVGNVPQGELVDPKEIDDDLQSRIDYINSQPLVRVAKDHSPVKDTIDVLLLEISEELAHLKWERRQNSRKGKSTAQLTVARIASLKQLADIILKRKDSSSNDQLSTKDPRVQKLFNIWIEMFHEALEASHVGPEIIDIIFNNLKNNMVDWEIKMESIDA